MGSVPRVVTLLSDFGLRDEYAGVMEAVIARIAPDARVVHLTHGIEPQGVLTGALALAHALPYAPVGVHVAVVDPGVGSERRAVVIATGDGRLLVGPDNGVLTFATDELGGITAAHAIENEELFLQPVSRTFHGRDVFAPVAGHLAAGLDPAQVGPVVDPATLVRIDLPPAQLEQGHVRATAMAIDRFGNVALSVRGAELDRLGLATGARIEISAGAGRYFALRARTFADVRVGEMVVFDDSSGWAALAMNSGSIVDICDIERGDLVDLRLR
jgi:S-adenosylmethionine hydrolase